VFKIKVIGIVGKTGCGKSIVSDYLAEKLKLAIKLDVDLLAKEIYKKNNYVTREIRNYFGNNVLNSDGSINFLNLGKRVFANRKEIKKLNKLMFPLICKESFNFIKENCYKNYIIINAAVLFDANLDIFCDKIILIKSIAKKRYEFLKYKSSDLSNEDINQRIKNQRIRIKKDKVDFIIENNSSINSLYRNLDNVINKL
jgi:dephospho-CoA kinase